MSFKPDAIRATDAKRVRSDTILIQATSELAPGEYLLAFDNPSGAGTFLIDFGISTSDATTAVAGLYLSSADNRDSLELTNSGTFILFQRGKRYTGTFESKENYLTMKVTGVRREQKAVISGDTITDPGGQVWVKSQARRQQ